MSEHNGDIPELTDAQKIRLRATVSDITEMSTGLRAGTATPDDVESAFSRLQSCDIDRNALVDAMHIPPDAGPHAPALAKILQRIPDGWGRWISHAAGWYPIVVACDQHLATIDRDYVVHQIKEKFGTLRYYCAPSSESTEVFGAFDAITIEAERMSAITCEHCGEPGVLHEIRSRVKTLCHCCADTLGYTPAQ
jgi:hypothetical protein